MSGSVTVTFGDVLYHEGADDGEVRSSLSPTASCVNINAPKRSETSTISPSRAGVQFRLGMKRSPRADRTSKVTEAAAIA